MKDDDVESMMDGLARKLCDGEFVVALVFVGRVERRFGANGLEMRLGMVSRRAPDLQASAGDDPERIGRALAAASVARAARECQDAIAQTVGDRAQALLQKFGEVREVRSPLRDKLNAKEAAE